jgi:hypothetical protein
VNEFDALRGRLDVGIDFTTGFTHGSRYIGTSYSWFDPRHGGQAFQDHLLYFNLAFFIEHQDHEVVKP